MPAEHASHGGFSGNVRGITRFAQYARTRNRARVNHVEHPLDSLADRSANSATHIMVAGRVYAVDCLWITRANLDRSADRCARDGGLHGQSLGSGNVISR
ncbi:MAG: hypothetical protein SGI88_22115 [Candidatus Hydrogenedentes bacterium]|nr:hypothetical protein [Candidatus Hydrogenedentota bacterium]